MWMISLHRVVLPSPSVSVWSLHSNTPVCSWRAISTLGWPELICAGLSCAHVVVMGKTSGRRQCLAFSQIAVIHPSHSLSKHVLNACNVPAAVRGSRDSVDNKNDKVPDYEVFTMQKPNGKIAFLAGRSLIDLLSELLHKPLHFSEGFKTLQSGTLVGGKRWSWNIAQRHKQDIVHDLPDQP